MLRRLATKVCHSSGRMPNRSMRKPQRDSVAAAKLFVQNANSTRLQVASTTISSMTCLPKLAVREFLSRNDRTNSGSGLNGGVKLGQPSLKR